MARKAQLAKILGDEHFLISCSLEQAVRSLQYLLLTVHHTEDYGVILDTVQQLDTQLANLQELELNMLYNPILLSP